MRHRDEFTGDHIKYDRSAFLDQAKQAIPVPTQFLRTILRPYRVPIVVRTHFGVTAQTERNSVVFVVGSLFRLGNDVMYLYLESAKYPAQATTPTGADQ